MAAINGTNETVDAIASRLAYVKRTMNVSEEEVRSICSQLPDQELAWDAVATANEMTYPKLAVDAWVEPWNARGLPKLLSYVPVVAALGYMGSGGNSHYRVNFDVLDVCKDAAPKAK